MDAREPLQLALVLASEHAVGLEHRPWTLLAPRLYGIGRVTQLDDLGCLSFEDGYDRSERREGA